MSDASFHETCATRTWVDDPRSGQRQKECGTWGASERKFGKIPAKKEEKERPAKKNRKKKEKKEQSKNCNMLDGKKKKKRKNKNRPTRKNRKKKRKEKNKGKNCNMLDGKKKKEGICSLCNSISLSNNIWVREKRIEIDYNGESISFNDKGLSRRIKLEIIFLKICVIPR